MIRTLDVTPHGKGFVVLFQHSRIYLCIHQMIELLRNICREAHHVFELGFFHFLQGNHQEIASTIDYRLYIGRLYLLLSEKELVEFLSTLWVQNQTLMNFIYMEIANQDALYSYQPSSQQLCKEAIG